MFTGGMFNACRGFNAAIGAWDTSSVTDMRWMFNACSLFNADITGWNTSAVVDMSFMMGNCLAFNRDLRPWDVSAVRARIAFAWRHAGAPFDPDFYPNFPVDDPHM